MALEGSIISASDTDNKPHSDEDQLQNREHPQEILSCCNFDKDNSLLSTNCSNTECMDSNQEDLTLNMKYQNEGTSKEHTYTITSCGDTAVESFTYEKDDNSGLPENQQREPEAERDTAKAVEDTKSDDTPTSTKDNILGCENINAPVDTVPEMSCDSNCGKAVGCLAQVETGNGLKSTFTNGEAEAVNTVTLKETDNRSHLQEHKGNNGTPTKELRLITKLKNYLTRFESSINVPEQNNSEFVGEYRNVDTQPLITETGPRDQAVNEQQEPRSDPQVRAEFPQTNHQNGSFTSKSNEENCSFLHSSTMTEEEAGKGHNQTEEMTTVLLPVLTLTRMHHASEDLSNSRGANHANLRSDEHQNCDRTIGATLDETVTLESSLKHNNHPGYQAPWNDSQRVHSEISAQIPDTSYFMRNPSYRSEEQQSSNTYSYETSQTEKIIVLHNPWATKPNGNTNHQSKSDPKCNTTSFHRDYSVGDISSTLKEADFADSLNELNLVRSKCEEMLNYFISAFERDQNIDFNTAVVSRDAVMERYLKHPPAPVDLKYEALNSFLELQMMMEAMQFVENKMRFISGEPTFRTLLWYDPSLKGELYKGKAGCQQQSSLYSSLHENNACESYSRLHQYFSHIPTLTHPHQISSDTSHYMYLKNKREKLEIQVALQNFADLESFFLSLPVSCIINFGDTLEDLETLQKRVISFTEVHSSQLQGPFDIGKAEHLLIMHRFISEKINYLLSCKVVDDKVSWFGLEHLQHDASKMLVWKTQKTQVPYRLLTKCNDAQRQTVIREDGAAILPLKRKSVTEAGIPTQKKRVAVKDRKSVLRGNAKKRQNCAQTKYYENVSVKKDLSSSMSRSGNIVKPSAKRAETPGSLFHIGARSGDSSTQYQPMTWATFMAAHNKPDHNPSHVHKEIPRTWPLIPSEHCTSTWTEMPCDRQNLEWNPSASFLPHTFKPSILKSHLEATPHLHTNQSVTATYSPLKVPAVRSGGESHLASQQQWHPSWSHKDTQEWSPSSKHPWSSVWGESEPALGLLPFSGDYLNPQNHWDPALFSSLSPLQPPLTFPSQGSPAPQSLCAHSPFQATTKPAPLLYKPKALSYPYFLWNQHTHTTASPALVPAPHLNGTSFHPYPERPRANLCLSDMTQHRHDL
ncbi:uncharacterized protein LOC118778129 [Megalops cyprinoides]|uniref:uncharacterized protein LOC118778129 n=1 Tax=Megalops cyprinoides TaxID=118141 RepID=UPI001864FA62|nr:uncharacterized protein LOC118778129 [Megalops cyprinoides]